MKWVKENIEGFGGDRTSITIFGQSSGAVSVHGHILSPRSKGNPNLSISSLIMDDNESISTAGDD